jgi:hypothetical protein
MFPTFKIRGKLRPALVGLVLWCLAAPARGDDLQYLPDGSMFVVSVDLAALLKTTTYKVTKSRIKAFDESLQKGLRDEMGILATNVARITAGVEAITTDGIIIYTTIKPVSAADIKAAKKPHSFKVNFKHREVKVGDYTIYEENYQFQSNPKEKPGPVQAEMAFCVVEERTVVYGRLEAVTKILERNKKPVLSAGVQAGLKQTGFASAVTLVMDLQAIPEREKKSMLKDFGKLVPGLADVADGMQTLAVRVNEKDNVTVTATMFCKDAASAANAKKVADDGVATVKGRLKDDPKLPVEVRETMKEVRTALGAVKLYTKDAQVNAEVTLDAAKAVTVVRTILEAQFQHGKVTEDATTPKNDK